MRRWLGCWEWEFKAIWAPPGDAPATLGLVFGVGQRENKRWCEQDSAAASFSPSQYSGWNLLEDGSIRIEEATEDALGTYTCVPYNALGTMGQSPPARLVLKVTCLLCQHVLVSPGGFLGCAGCWDPKLGAVDVSISPKHAAVWLGEPSCSQIMTIFKIITIFFFKSACSCCSLMSVG